MQVYNSTWQQALLTKKHTLLLSILVQKIRSAEACSTWMQFFFKTLNLVIIPQVEGAFPVLGNDPFSSSGEMLFGLEAQVQLDLRLSLVWIPATKSANTASCILKLKIHAAVIYYLRGSCKITLNSMHLGWILYLGEIQIKQVLLRLQLKFHPVLSDVNPSATSPLSKPTPGEVIVPV